MIHGVANWLFYEAYLQRRRPSGTPYRRLCIYKVDRLGDFVLALGAIRQLVQAYGEENCVLVVSQYAAELAAREFPRAERIIFRIAEGYLWRTPKHLRALQSHPLLRQGVEHLVCLRHHRTLFEELQISAIPAGKTWGSRNYELYREPGDFARCKLGFDHEMESVEPAANECREIALHRAIVMAVTGKPATEAECFPKLSTFSQPAEKVAGISPFGSDAIRNFPPKLLGKVAQSLGNKLGLPFRVWTPPGQEERYRNLVETLRKEGVPDVAIEVTPTLEHLIQSIARSSLVLTADTATAHIAAALDRPMIAVLGGGHYGWFGPWSRSAKQHWVTHSVDCFHCNWICRHAEPLCITGISHQKVEELAVAVSQLA